MARDYGRISTGFWNHPKIYGCSDQAKLLANYLMTGPHSNACGAYLLPDAYVADDLKWSSQTVSKAFAELFQIGFAKRFLDGRHIVVCDFLDWNPIENPNVGKGVLRQVALLPDDPALEFIFNGLLRYAEHFPNGFGTLSERFDKPFRNTEPNRTEPEPTLSSADAASKEIVESQFEEFYAAFPKHVGRGQALKAYRSALKIATGGVLLTGARRYAASVVGKEPQFVAHPATWLNGQRWLDELSTAGPDNVVAIDWAAFNTPEERDAQERRKQASG